MKRLEKLFKAFGNTSRLKILLYLKKHTSGSVVEISKETKCSYKAASKHLGILFREDIVDRDQVVFEMRYKISTSISKEVSTLLKFI